MFAALVGDSWQPLSALRARELRQLLLDSGASVDGLFDKEALLSAALLLQANMRTPAASRGVETPLVFMDAASLVAGVRTSQAPHAALRVTTAGGATLCFVLDTAASTSIVLPAVAARLRLPRTGVTAGSGVSGTGRTAETYQVALGELRSVPGGELLVPNQLAVVLDLPTGDGTDGLLGLDFCSAFDALELVWSPPAVTLHARGSFTAASWAATAKGLSECLLSPVSGGLLALRVIPAGSRVELLAIVDTGAAFTTINCAAAAALGLRGEDTAQTTWVTGLGGRPLAVRTAERDLQLEGVVSTAGAAAAPIGSVRPLIGDLPAFAQFGLGASPACILGLDAIMQRPRVVMSTSTRRMLF